MSTIEPLEGIGEPWDDLDTPSARGNAKRIVTSIIPRSSISGRALAALIAIMTFLAALTIGGVMMVVRSANDWRSDVGREITIQIRPADGRDIEADVRNAVELTRATAGIADVRAYSKEESARLVEPWLGAGLALEDLPIPRLIVVKLTPGGVPDLTALRRALAVQVPPSSLDDHRQWMDRMRAVGETAIAAGVAILGLVLVVTVLSVTFATRGAMATNRPIIEVLHYVGATDGFIANQFQRHFIGLGLKGGAIGGGVAIVLFGLIEAANAWFARAPGGGDTVALFGTFSIGIAGYFAILILVVLLALVTGLTSRRTVNRTLMHIE